jgi:hypothetical protein
MMEEASGEEESSASISGCSFLPAKVTRFTGIRIVRKKGINQTFFRKELEMQKIG